MKKINLNAARKELEELKRVQGVQDITPFVIATVEPSGIITASLYRGLPKSGKCKCKHISFYSLRDLLKYSGISDRTNLILDDMVINSDLYLPTDLILWLCQPEEIACFAQFAQKGDQIKWLTKYVELIKVVQEEQFTIPNEMADNPALNDLMQSYNLFTITQLVERYQDKRWFQG